MTSRLLALSCLALVLAACGSLRDDGPLSGAAPTATPAVSLPLPAQRTLPPDDPSLKGCLADWVEGFRSLPPMVDRAELIVRARPVSTMTSAERGGLTGYRTTLRVEHALKGRPPVTATVVETACPVVAGGADEWLLFLASKLDDPGVFNVVGGIQGAFPIRAGRVAPSYRDAYLVRTYTGVDPSELERDVAAIDPIDGDATARLRALGWNVVATQTVSTFELPPLTEWGETKLPPHIERPFEGYMRIANTGLDLRPYAGREVEQLAFWVERSPNDGLAPVARLVYAARRFVGGWIQVDATQLFRLDDRAHALAASPRPLAAPTPAPNRYPAGVNVAVEYGLARATTVYVKPLTPSAKPVPAPALAEVVHILDRTLPTESAPPGRSEGYWVVGFHIDDTLLVFEYVADAGLLVQRDDGWAVRPDAAFARLIGAAP